MKTLRAIAVVCVAGATLLGAPLAMAKVKEKSSANETNAAKVEKPGAKQLTYLGVGVEPSHPAFWRHLRNVLEHEQGLLVAQVAKDSPAEKAGLQADDILMTYGDQKLFFPDQLAGLVQADKPGHEVTLGIVRDGKSQKIRATLGEHAVQHALRDARQYSPYSWYLSSPRGVRRSPDVRHPSSYFHPNRFSFWSIPEWRWLMPNGEFRLDLSGVYSTPDGQMIWNFHELDSAFWPMLPSEL